MIKKIQSVLLGLLIISSCLGQQQEWVDSRSKVEFVINNLGIGTKGDFKGLTGKISWNPANPSASSLQASVDASTIDTDIKARDNHLKKEDYFDVAKYPTLSFKSTAISLQANGQYLAKGILTIKDVAKTIELPFTVNKQADGFLFTGEIKINRRDFKVGGRSLTLSNDVKIKLSVFAKNL